MAKDVEWIRTTLERYVPCDAYEINEEAHLVYIYPNLALYNYKDVYAKLSLDSLFAMGGNWNVMIANRDCGPISAEVLMMLAGTNTTRETTVLVE